MPTTLLLARASSASAGATTSAAASIQVGSNLKVVGIILAITSGLLIGSSFVFKKKGLLRSQAGGEAGEGVAYLKSPLWWTGMIMMILGELCNFAAYAFVEALVVTPLGALSVVICAILSSIFLNEKLTFFGWLGCSLCIIGSTIIALNGPQEASVGQITQFEKLFLAPGFLAYGGTLIAASLVIIFYFAPKHGKKSMLWYISVCSMIGGISVSVTTGLGAAIVTTAMGDNQFKHWFIYFLIIFVAVTLITEVYYLNVALALFNTAMVTPTYYVIFTFCSMLTTVVLFQGLKASATQIITIVMAFLVICCGITILQMSKIDPTEIKLDRRSTLLLQAARQNTMRVDEKDLTGLEDPGIDSIRGSFGPLGSMIRARSARRLSQSSRGASTIRSRNGMGTPRQSFGGGRLDPSFDGLQRHQLYDAPVPSFSFTDAGSDRVSMFASPGHTPQPPRTPTIKFGTEEIVHKYQPSALGSGALATHERRDVSNRSFSPSSNTYSLPVIQEGFVEGLPLRQPRPVPAGLGRPSLSTSAIESGLRTAPAAMFSGGQSPDEDGDISNSSSPYHVDPFDAPTLPATADPSTSSFRLHSRPELMMVGNAERSFSESAVDDGSRAAWRRERERERGHGGHGHRHNHNRTSSRSYPKTGGDEDREESVSLVHNPSLDSLEGVDVQPEPGGIRLVQSTGRF